MSRAGSAGFRRDGNAVAQSESRDPLGNVRGRRFSQNVSFSSEDNYVGTVLATICDNYLIAKAAPDARNHARIVVSVHNKNSLGRQRVEAGIVEPLVAQLRWLTFFVKTVHQQHIELPRLRPDELRPVFAIHRESLIVRGYEKTIPQRNYIWIDLRDADPRIGQIPVTVLCLRSAPKTDHPDMAGLLIEEKKTHHRPRVAEQEFMRSVLLHGALNLERIEMKPQAAFVIADER